MPMTHEGAPAIPFDRFDRGVPRGYDYDRRQKRLELPPCPTCHTPPRVDLRSADTLYATCQGCGRMSVITKPTRAALL